MARGGVRRSLLVLWVKEGKGASRFMRHSREGWEGQGKELIEGENMAIRGETTIASHEAFVGGE